VNLKNKSNFILLLVFFGAAFILFSGIKKNLPYLPEGDEKNYWVSRAVNMADTLSPNPGFFGHPGSTMLYPMAVIYRILYGDQTLELFDHSPTWFYLIGRMLTALYGLMTLPIVYYIGRRLFGELTSLIGTGLLVVNILIVYFAQIVRTDMAALFFGMLSVLCMLRLYEKPNYGNQILTGVVIGLGISSRYFMVVSGLVLLVLDGYLFWKNRRRWRTIVSQALVGVVFIGIAFALTTPYFFLDFETALKDIQTEARTVHVGADGLSPIGNFFFYVTEVIPINLGWVQLVFLIAGIVLVLRSRQFQWLLFLSFGLIFLILVSLPALHWDRWLIQAFPVFHLLAAFGLVSLAQKYFRTPSVYRLMLGVGIIAISVQPAYQTIGHVVQGLSPSTRIMAREWIILNLEPSDHILQEWYTSILTQTEYNPVEVFSVAQGKSMEDYVNSDYDYLIVSSQIYTRFYKEPDRYPQEIVFYEELFKCDCLAQKFVSTETRGAPTIHIFDLNKLR
jgi:4-amino-4-deoxy-L-arabinose transferase-like glycosyltransferase